ncbi:flagellar brake protein [Alkalibacillus silvisoli]|uniref:Cyclic di-GMP receptor DgrA n=1 Tax=Alkalibacillus silvisoli TaxID=392823 RepID=A0ABN0ZU35_9BACI
MLSVGMKLTIEVVKGDQVEEKLHTKIVDLTKKRIYVDYPINQRTGRTFYFINNTKVRVSFVSDHDIVYMFYCDVKRRKKKKIPLIEIPFPNQDELIKVQRREYVRIEANLDVAVHSLDEEKEPLITHTLDLSGGGIAVKSTSQQFEQGEEVDLMLVLPFGPNDYVYLNIKGEVIRYAPSKEGQDYILSLKFKSIEDTKRETIIKYCFDQQLERRRKLNT